MIDTVIFDLDGTLLNTLDDLTAGFNYAISSFGYPERTAGEIRSFVGNGIKKAIERALPQKVSEDEFNKITECFMDYYQKNMDKQTRPYEGITELLETLDKCGYKLAVVSNKYDAAVKALVNKHFGSYIDIAIGESVNIKRKPEPDGVFEALKELNSAAGNAIYIGDSEVDIQTAKNAGLPCISVLWGFKDKDFLIQNGGGYFAKTPEDIINIVKEFKY